MAYKERLISLLQSGAAMTAASSIIATGSYIIYKDCMRYPRMEKAYSRGNILAPMADNRHEVVYFKRADVERKLHHVMCPCLANEYYLVNGEVGSGKTRTIVELVRKMMMDEGKKDEGAPIYVLATQGTSFPETLASSVNFRFDEHISFKFFLDFVLRIHSFPGREDHHKLTRVLDAIEKSAFAYLQRTGRPVVLIIDGASHLTDSLPGALEKLQTKAKLWADTNIVKVVFVTNEENTEVSLQEHASDWSRAATPVHVGDLTKQEAIAFLTNPSYMEAAKYSTPTPLDEEQAEKIYHLVGGRVHHLIAFKRDWVRKIPFKDTAIELKAKEREKFLNVSRSPSQWKVVELIMASPHRKAWMSQLVDKSSQDDVYALLKHNIIRIERHGTGILCKFESKLTENVIEQFYTKPK